MGRDGRSNTDDGNEEDGGYMTDDDSRVQKIPLFPLGVVLLPGLPLPLHIFEDRYKEMVAACLSKDSEFGVVFYNGDTIADVGCTAGISQVLKRYTDGRIDILTMGRRRFRIQSLIEEQPYMEAEVEFFEDAPEPADDTQRRLVSDGLKRLENLIELEEKSLDLAILHEMDPTSLSFFITGNDGFTMEEKQRFLEMVSTRKRLETGVKALDGLIDRLEVARQIRRIIGGNGHFPKLFPPR